MEALTNGVASVVLEEPVGLLELIAEDVLPGILCMVAGAPSIFTSSKFTATTAPILWRISRTCVMFRRLISELVPPALASQAKLFAMQGVLMPAIVTTTHVWPIAYLSAPESDQLVSKMDIVRYIIERADPLWCEAGPYNRVLNGGIDAIEKRVRKKRSKVSRTDIVAAYSAFIETTPLDVKSIFTQAGFMHPSSARLLARATLHALVKHAIDERLDI